MYRWIHAGSVALDRLIGEIDKIIKTLTLSPRASRGVPQAAAGEALPEAERAESVRLMRVNHAGEVAAQALYQGQALTARDPDGQIGHAGSRRRGNRSSGLVRTTPEGIARPAQSFEPALVLAAP